MGDCDLDSGDHGVLLFFGHRILFPWSAVLLDHAHELDVAAHDGRDGGEEAGAEEEVGKAGYVEEGGRGGEARGEEAGLNEAGGQGIEDVETPGEGVQSNWEVDNARVDGEPEIDVLALWLRSGVVALGSDCGGILGVEFWHGLTDSVCELGLDLCGIAHLDGGCSWEAGIVAVVVRGKRGNYCVLVERKRVERRFYSVVRFS